MLDFVLERMRNWFRWQLNLRVWRRRLHESPKLARCWNTVKKHPDFRSGFFAADGEIVPAEILWKQKVTLEPWFPAVRLDVDKGSNEFVKITLTYLIRKRPNDRYQETLFVSTLDYRLLGKTSSHLLGF